LIGESVAWLLAVLVACLILAPLVYPGELSFISSGLHRWLYDRAAGSYHRKWQSAAYRDPEFRQLLVEFARQSLLRSKVERVLDLGCGTGRGIRQLVHRLPSSTRFKGIDFSKPMLAVFRRWLTGQEYSVSDRIELSQLDLADWSGIECNDEHYGLVLVLEVGEFLPNFAQIVVRVAGVLPSGGGLILTRPAGIWGLFFPGRKQSRRALTRLLVSSGFAAPEFLKWRSRYEVVLARKH
jgi:SAM-dependent methyltransferase